MPSLLNWHFTDRFYHSSQDRPDKTSAAEMENVGVAVATSAWFLASADAARTRPRSCRSALVGRVGRRLALEREQGATLVASAANRADAEATEAKVIAAWVKWYGEALDSVAEAAGRAARTRRLRAKVTDAKGRLQ